MSIKRLKEKELLEGLDAYKVHADELATLAPEELEPPDRSEDSVLDALRMTAIAEAVELFDGDQKASAQWLSAPVRALGHKRPNDLLRCEEGVQQVRDIIGRLEHGVIT